MPGLFGFLEKREQEPGDRLLRALQSPLMHFASYRSEQVSHSHVGVGFVAVGKTGSLAESNGITVCCYGDVYADIGLAGTKGAQGGQVDASGVLRMYEKCGESLPGTISGHFNIFINDRRSNVTYLFNDRFGHRHLYLYQSSGSLLFSPEIKSFLACEGLDMALDEQGLSDFFVYSYQLSDRTFFRNIKLLPPASILRIADGEIARSTYWSPEYRPTRDKTDLYEVADLGYDLFEQSVDRCLGSGRDILVPLSGGLDSRLILSVASRRSLNISTATFGHRKCHDYRIARNVCETLGMAPPRLITICRDWLQRYAEQMIHLGECTYGALGATTQHGMAQMVGGAFDVSLNGLYGGHLSFGSPYYTRDDLNIPLAKEERIKRIVRGFNGHRFSAYLEQVMSQQVLDQISTFKEQSIREEWQRSARVSDLDACRQDHIFVHNRIRRGMNNLNQNRFFFNDKQPFASYGLYDFYLSLSPELVLDHFLYKEIYKRRLPMLARIPWQQTGVNLYRRPSRLAGLRRRVKSRLSWSLNKYSKGRLVLADHSQYENPDVSYRKSLRLQSWVRSLLLSERCLDRGYYDRKGLEGLLLDAGTGKNVFHEVSKLVMFELWSRTFIDGDGDQSGHEKTWNNRRHGVGGCCEHVLPGREVVLG